MGEDKQMMEHLAEMDSGTCLPPTKFGIPSNRVSQKKHWGKLKEEV